jgi:hypothetical protein
MRTLGHVYLPGLPGTSVGKFSFLVEAGDVEVGVVVAADTDEGVVVGSVVDLRVVGTDDDPVRLAPARSGGVKVGFLPEVLVADVQVLASDRLRPVRAGVVRPATRAEVESASGQDQMAWPIPAGCVELLGEREGERELVPVCVDGTFLCGPEAQGIVVAGKSGVASKTSFLTVLLRSVLNSGNDRDRRTAALLFNVKGTDLVEIDKPADPAVLTDEDRLIYEAMGLDGSPFADVAVYAPSAGLGQSQARSSREDARVLSWDLATIWDQLYLLFEEIHADEKLASFVAMFGEQKVRAKNPSNRIDTFDALDRWFEAEIEDAEEAGRTTAWGDTHVATMRRLKRKFRGLRARGRGLFAGGHSQPHEDVPVTNWKHGQVLVVDIAGLEPDVQGFVIARTIKRVMDAAEEGLLGVDHLIIGADELNAWAPSQGAEMGEVRKWLRRVATQGRYAGLSIFGACQAASRIDALIMENCATRAVGASAETELTSGVHGKMPAGLVERLATLPKGRMALWHTAYRQSIVVRFARPAWRMGRSATTGGRKPSGVSLLREHIGESSMERLVEGVPAHIAQEVIAESSSLEQAKADLAKIRQVDMTRANVHTKRTFDESDPYGIND